MTAVPDPGREGLIVSVLERVEADFAGTLPAGRLRRLVESYVRHVGADALYEVGADALVAMIGDHLRLGARRSAGETRLAITTPTETAAGWSLRGSTLVQAVLGDRPFLVDTFIMAATGLGWTIREVFHPQCLVLRDGSGRLTGFAGGPGGGAIAEAWICLEIFPAAGSAAGDVTPALHATLRQNLEKGAAAVADFSAMVGRLRAEIAMLREDAADSDDVSAADLLAWLADGNFVFLGFREYAFDGEFHPVDGSGLGIRRAPDEPGTFHAYPGSRPPRVVITKDPHFSPVHRRAYLEYIGVRRFDAAGRMVGEARFIGLFAAPAYIESVFRVPGLRTKAERLLSMGQYGPDSHGRARLQRAIATYPRDELFQAGADELFPILDQVAAMLEKRLVRVFVRPSIYGQFVSVTVYLPRDRYVTRVRQAIQQILLDALGGVSLDHQAQLSESVIARLFFVVRIADSGKVAAMDVATLERRIAAACRNWDDDFLTAAADLPSEERGVEFSEGYQAAHDAEQAVADLCRLNALSSSTAMGFAVVPSEDVGDIRFKVFTGTSMSLAAAMPHLTNLGAAVVDERPYDVLLRGEPYKIYDFGLDLSVVRNPAAAWSEADRTRFTTAFEASYRGETDSDALSRLVVTAGLTWRQVSWLRALSRYLQQAGVPFSQPYIASALTSHTDLAALLVEWFETRFDPDRGLATADRAVAAERIRERFLTGLEDVASLDHDRILRRCAEVLAAVVRTNAYQPDAEALALKLRPREISFLPEPRPLYEIFVHSPRVTGTHLRFGPVARGGLRWSDRVEDFRTEVLGLVKAQAVKNTVIVPDGAKGGFVPLRLPSASAGRAAVLAEGVAAYRVFISSLLSVTDNTVGGRIEPPSRCIRYDEDDPYLVVAADKGTATFSDIANEISTSRGFWLGDAFASGGSAGYDHKAMGITARGAWESAVQHFAGLGIDERTTDFTVVGVGDMSGDVFGNGMLRSRHIRLVAAFNHLHVFIDPDPDPDTSFAERQRLFDLPRSTWADYDPAVLSPGGGVYPRSAKAITLSPRAKAVLGVAPDVGTMTPAEVVSAILRAPVDLLFNGGIGTYVRGSDESSADVGDRANDMVRVTGKEVRARSAVEGGNLGWTQRGRVEYALRGGRINTDFIDNSAGVDTSDHEVNIKILLAGPVERGVLTQAGRNELLAAMTEDVAAHALHHNEAQNLILTDAEHRGTELAAAHETLMADLERRGFMDRERESLPSTTEFAARVEGGRGLTRPELAVLLAHAKLMLKAEILASDLPADPFLRERLHTYFPPPLRERFHAEMERHPLGREIIAMVTVNRFVDSQGITAFHRLQAETGAEVGDIVRAQLAARSLVDAAVVEREIGSCGVDYAARTRGRVLYRRAVERTARVLLHTRRLPLDVTTTVTDLHDDVVAVRRALRTLLPARFAAEAERVEAEFQEAGYPAHLATAMGTAEFSQFATAVAQIPREDVPVEVVAGVYFGTMERLSLDVLYQAVDALPRTGRWDTMARAAQRDDLLGLLDRLTAAVLEGADGGSATERIDRWATLTPQAAAKARFVAEVSAGNTSLAQVAVGLRQARTLVQGGRP
ncbi:NAD-glutamate dehydrogenase [Propionicicella superfundia]|uniref:NAD-glutamate dehydrogenase n=1 Tax=Propionicicella superfundia TaxID=348582 RepID=UPI00042A1E6F|nr:NAD-glutamate dehydrogenase [Propionicicella superfundia]